MSATPVDRATGASGKAAALRPLEVGVVTVAAVVAAVAAVVSRSGAVVVAGGLVSLWLVRAWPQLTIWALTFEMVLGGWGHVIDVAGLPVRHVLLALAMATWLFNKILDGDWRLRGAPYLTAILAFLAFVFVVVLVSVAVGNPYAADDGLTPAFLLLTLPFADLASRPGGALWLVRSLLVAMFALATVQIGLTMGIAVGALDGNALAVVFDRRLGGVNQSGLPGPFWRVFFVGAIYYQVVILLLVAVRLAREHLLGRRLDAVLLAITTFGLLLSYTRGFWLATVLGLGVLVLLTTRAGRVKWVAGALLGMLALIAVSQLADTTFVDGVVMRLARLLDPDRDYSVAMRLDLYPRLMARIAERPLLGYGFGLPIENQLYYENTYFYYLLKFGLIGMVVLAWGWVLLLWHGVRLARTHADPRSRAIAAGVVAAVVSVLAVTSINPFINSAVGLYFQALMSAVLYGLARYSPISALRKAQQL